MDVEIAVLDGVTDEVIAAFAGLVPQLSPAARAPDRAAVCRVVDAAANTVLVARLGGEIVGLLTLVTVPAVTGVRARIEDVVVAGPARGHGVGAALTNAAIALAAAAGAVAVDLTSRPSRTAANRLYQRLGFELRDTNVYRYPLG